MIKQHEHHGFSSVDIVLGDQTTGAYFVLTYVYFDEHHKPHVEVFDDCDMAEVGAGDVNLDRRKNTATLILHHRYGCASNEAIERLAVLLSYTRSGILTAEQIDTIVKEVA